MLTLLVPTKTAGETWTKMISFLMVNEYDVNEYDVNEYDVNEYDVNEYDVNEYDDNKQFAMLHTSLTPFVPHCKM